MSDLATKVVPNLVRDWWHWRVGQDAAADPTNPPFGAGVGGMAKKLTETELDALVAKALSVTSHGGTEEVLRTLPRIGLPIAAQEVDPRATHTPGQSSPQSILGVDYAKYLEAATIDPVTRPHDIAARARKRGEIQADFKPMSELKQDYKLGKPREDWYAGTYPQWQEEVGRLDELIRKSGLPGLDLQKDPLNLTKFTSAMSPKQTPLAETASGVREWARWLRDRRNPDQPFARWDKFKTYQNNLRNAAQGKPLSGLKVSNYVLDKLGSEVDPTNDRWIVNEFLGKPSDKADVSPIEYQTIADHIKSTVSKAFGTTPVRAQAALWTGSKILRDEDTILLLDKLAKDQAIPPLRDIIAVEMSWLRDAFKADPRILTPTVALASLLLKSAGRENSE
jgi:hypothetical protein